jgi:hypothetical protein
MNAVISLIRSPSSVMTSIAAAFHRPVSSSTWKYATAGWPLARMGIVRDAAQNWAACSAKPAIVARPRS